MSKIREAMGAGKKALDKFTGEVPKQNLDLVRRMMADIRGAMGDETPKKL